MGYEIRIISKIDFYIHYNPKVIKFYLYAITYLDQNSTKKNQGFGCLYKDISTSVNMYLNTQNI